MREWCAQKLPGATNPSATPAPPPVTPATPAEKNGLESFGEFTKRFLATTKPRASRSPSAQNPTPTPNYQQPTNKHVVSTTRSAAPPSPHSWTRYSAPAPRSPQNKREPVRSPDTTPKQATDAHKAAVKDTQDKRRASLKNKRRGLTARADENTKKCDAGKLNRESVEDLRADLRGDDEALKKAKEIHPDAPETVRLQIEFERKLESACALENARLHRALAALDAAVRRDEEAAPQLARLLALYGVDLSEVGFFTEYTMALAAFVAKGIDQPIPETFAPELERAQWARARNYLVQSYTFKLTRKPSDDPFMAFVGILELVNYIARDYWRINDADKAEKVEARMRAALEDGVDVHERVPSSVSTATFSDAEGDANNGAAASVTVFLQLPEPTQEWLARAMLTLELRMIEEKADPGNSYETTLVRILETRRDDLLTQDKGAFAGWLRGYAHNHLSNSDSF